MCEARGWGVEELECRGEQAFDRVPVSFYFPLTVCVCVHVQYIHPFFVGLLVGAQVMTDPMTGESKGYGFVRFTSREERDR